MTAKKVYPVGVECCPPPRQQASPEVLADLLREISVHGCTYTLSVLHGPWNYYNPPSDTRSGFHYVIEGSCWIHYGQEIVQLHEGDFVFFPRLIGHEIKNEPASKVTQPEDLSLLQTGRFSYCMTKNGTGSRSKLICGGAELAPAWHPFIQSLPPMIKLPMDSSSSDSWAGAILSLISDAAEKGKIGSGVIADRLTEALVLETVRHWLETSDDSNSGWLAAFSHPRLAKSIQAIHSTPGQAWTVSSLAAVAGMCRTSFSRLFTEVLSIPPILYLSCFKMKLAGDALRSGEDICDVAARLGFKTERGFRQSFFRFWGAPPSVFRAGISKSFTPMKEWAAKVTKCRFTDDCTCIADDCAHKRSRGSAIIAEV